MGDYLCRGSIVNAHDLIGGSVAVRHYDLAFCLFAHSFSIAVQS